VRGAGSRPHEPRLLLGMVSKLSTVAPSHKGPRRPCPCPYRLEPHMPSLVPFLKSTFPLCVGAGGGRVEKSESQPAEFFSLDSSVRCVCLVYQSIAGGERNRPPFLGEKGTTPLFRRTCSWVFITKGHSRHFPHSTTSSFRCIIPPNLSASPRRSGPKK